MTKFTKNPWRAKEPREGARDEEAEEREGDAWASRAGSVGFRKRRDRPKPKRKKPPIHKDRVWIVGRKRSGAKPT